MTIITDLSELTLNLFECLSNKKPIVFKTKLPKITFGIFKSREFLGIGSCSICNNPQWVSIYPPEYKNNLPLSSFFPSQHKQSSFSSTSNQSLVENLRIKLKFSKESRDGLMRTSSTSQKESNTNVAQNNIATPFINNSMSIDLKHKNAKSLASLLLTSPLSSSQQHKHKMHNLNNIQKILNNSSHKISPNKQPKNSNHILWTSKKRKLFNTINNNSSTAIGFGNNNIINSKRNNSLCYTKSCQNNLFCLQSSSTNVRKINNSSSKASPKQNKKQNSCVDKQNINNILNYNDFPIQTAPNLKTLGDYRFNSSKILHRSLLISLDNQELEDHIINQSFEDNIKKDEIIDDENTNKSFIKYLNDNIKYINDDIITRQINYKSGNDNISFNVFNKDDLILNDLTEKFNNLNFDLNLLYNKDYFEEVDDSVLNFEVELIIEKILELQSTFYALLKSYKIFNNKINIFTIKTKSKMKMLLKKQFQLKLESVDLLYKPMHVQTETITPIHDISFWKHIFLQKCKNKFHTTKVDLLNDHNNLVKEKTLILSIIKNVLRNKQTMNKLSNLERTTLKRIINENDVYSPKQTPKNNTKQMITLSNQMLTAIKNRNNDFSNVDYYINTNLNSPLIDERLNTLKKKLLPLINENTKENELLHNFTVSSGIYNNTKKRKYKQKTQSKSTRSKATIKKK